MINNSRRALAIIALVVASLATYWYFFRGEPQVYNEPLEVPFGATVVQEIRNDDGTKTSWTYRKEVLQEDSAAGSEAPEFPPSTGAASLLNQRALNAWNSGDIRGALDLFEKAIAADPNDPEPHSNYGRRLTVMAAHDKALPLLQRASELQPDDPQVWLDLLTAYEATLQFQRANEVRQKARRLAGDRAFVRNEQGAWRLEGSSLP